ncbi:hypothetical protein EVAR_34159_1 [Eumeta japonica]|uniref:Uncharacterized protein n=1 Tax=Eumeta variegata TaxID=151549 RepID=A0A4C1WHK0_EUMVA|nr:hypothetical protein EVAR_34159_1 [Eumeta japonica]
MGPVTSITFGAIIADKSVVRSGFEGLAVGTLVSLLFGFIVGLVFGSTEMPRGVDDFPTEAMKVRNTTQCEDTDFRQFVLVGYGSGIDQQRRTCGTGYDGEYASDSDKTAKRGKEKNKRTRKWKEERDFESYQGSAMEIAWEHVNSYLSYHPMDNIIIVFRELMNLLVIAMRYLDNVRRLPSSVPDDFEEDFFFMFSE